MVQRIWTYTFCIIINNKYSSICCQTYVVPFTTLRMSSHIRNVYNLSGRSPNDTLAKGVDHPLFRWNLGAYVEAFSCLALTYNWTQHSYINISKIKRANCFYRSTIISFIWRASVCRFIAHIEMNMLRLRRLLKVCVCTLVIWICCKIELHSQYTRVN